MNLVTRPTWFIQRVGWTGLVTAAVLLVNAGSLPAHEGHSGEQAVIDGVSPPVKGVTVDTVQGGFGKVALTTRGDTTAVVIGPSGRPFVRIGPAGVDANVAAADWYRQNEPLGIARVPARTRASARERWRRVSVLRSWEWFDHRLHPRGRRTDRWLIPLVVDGRKAVIRGRITPAPGALGIRVSTSPASGLEASGLSQPAISLRVRGTRGSEATIFGRDGEVFARLGRRGVEVNVRSPVWLPTAQYRNGDLLASVIDPAAPARFVVLGPVPELTWPDPRLLPQNTANVARWSIPASLSGRGRVLIRGTTALQRGAPAGGNVRPQEKAPPEGQADDGGVSAGLIAVGVSAALALLAGAALIARGRR